MLAIILSSLFAGDMSGNQGFRRSNTNGATGIGRLNRTLAYFEGRNRLVEEQIAQAIAASQERIDRLKARKAQNDAEISRVKALRDRLVGNNNIASAENVVTQNVAEELTPLPIVEAPAAFTVAADTALPFSQEAAPVTPQEVAPPVAMTELPAPVAMTEVSPSSSAETPVMTTAAPPAEVPAEPASTTEQTATPAITDVTSATATTPMETPQADQGAPTTMPVAPEEQPVATQKTLD